MKLIIYTDSKFPTKRELYTLIKNKAPNCVRLDFRITSLFLFHLKMLNEESGIWGQWRT